MRAIRVTAGPDGPALSLGEVPVPVPGPSEVLIDIVATAVNRADLMQAAGHYPPPPGASDILGLECSGTVAALGQDAQGWAVGGRVCALLAGGGYAEQVAVPAVQVLPLPPGVDLVTAAGLPEVCCTVWSNLVMAARLRAGETVLIHGGASGIGTIAIQLARALGARVAVTASRSDALETCRRLGAEIGINYRDEDFGAAIRDATGGRGADVILDIIGAKYLQRNVASLADGGRLVIIGLQGGTRAELDINALMRTRGSVIGTALRSRPVTGPGSKAEIVAAVREKLWPLFDPAGPCVLRPVVDTVMSLADAGAAHARIAAGGHVGKVLLTVSGREQTSH